MIMKHKAIKFVSGAGILAVVFMMMISLSQGIIMSMLLGIATWIMFTLILMLGIETYNLRVLAWPLMLIYTEGVCEWIGEGIED